MTVDQLIASRKKSIAAVRQDIEEMSKVKSKDGSVPTFVTARVNVQRQRLGRLELELGELLEVKRGAQVELPGTGPAAAGDPPAPGSVRGKAR